MLNRCMRIFFLMAIFSSVINTAQAKFGVGVVLGDPTALSGKYFMSENSAADAGLSFGDHHILVYGDYLQHWPGLFNVQNEFISSLSPYVGVGPIFAWNNGHNDRNKHHIFEDEDNDFALGARIPLGIEWMAPEIPVGVSLEVVPGVIVLEETDGFLQGGLGIRYYFQ